MPGVPPAALPKSGTSRTKPGLARQNRMVAPPSIHLPRGPSATHQHTLYNNVRAGTPRHVNDSPHARAVLECLCTKSITTGSVRWGASSMGQCPAPGNTTKSCTDGVEADVGTESGWTMKSSIPWRYHELERVVIQSNVVTSSPEIFHDLKARTPTR